MVGIDQVLEKLSTVIDPDLKKRHCVNGDDKRP